MGSETGLLGGDLQYYLVPTLCHEISIAALEVVLSLQQLCFLGQELQPGLIWAKLSGKTIFLTAHDPEPPDKHRNG